MTEKFAYAVADWLARLGYTHCLLLAGGNRTHLLDACRTRLKGVATVHHVVAGVATEYFDEAMDGDERRVLDELVLPSGAVEYIGATATALALAVTGPIPPLL